MTPRRRPRRPRGALLALAAMLASVAVAPTGAAESSGSVDADAFVEPPAVAARFVDPPVTYRTPAFAPGHAGFTSNDELHAFGAALESSGFGRAAGANVRVLGLGSSQSGAPLEAWLLAHGVAGAGISPDEVVEGQRPTVLLVGGQHGNEPAGTEALMVVAEALVGGRLERLLDRINVVVLARANPDGAALGRRATASGIDMNRDHLWLDTPEAQAVAQLVREFAPVAVIDLHEYDARGDRALAPTRLPRADAMLQVATTANLAPFVTKAADEWFRAAVVAGLEAEALRSDDYHVVAPNPATAELEATMGSTAPDSLRNASGLRNSVGLLVETRGGALGKAHLARRVFTQVTALTSALTSAATRADALVKLRRYVDLEVTALACRGDMVLQVETTPSERRVAMLDAQTGADTAVIARWRSALALRPVKSRTRPCGYWLAADQSDAVGRLRSLGVRVERIEEPGDVRGETYRETARTDATDAVAPASVASPAGDIRVQVQTVPTLLDIAAGAFYVPLDQPFADLAVAALEPDTTFGFVAHRIVTRLDHLARVLARPHLRTSPMP